MRTEGSALRFDVFGEAANEDGEAPGFDGLRVGLEDPAVGAITLARRTRRPKRANMRT